MELSSLNFTEKSDNPQRFPVIHPQTLKPMGWDLDILGPDATKKHQFLLDVRDEVNERVRRAVMDGVSMDFSSAEKADMALREAAVLVTGWQGLTENGQPLAYSEEACHTLLSKNRWLISQVMEANKSWQVWYGLEQDAEQGPADGEVSA